MAGRGLASGRDPQGRLRDVRGGRAGPARRQEGAEGPPGAGRIGGRAPLKREGNRPFGLAVTSTLLATLAVGSAAHAQVAAPGEAPVVERLEIDGSDSLREETLLFYVSTKPGDRYDERRLREDFRRLWSTGLLDDLRLDVSPGETGKLVVFRVTEKKRVRSVEYHGSRALTTERIEEGLAKRSLKPRIDALHDAAALGRADAGIREMLAEKGHPFATVEHETRNVGRSGIAIRIVVHDGPRTQVKEIAFSGNRAFSDGTLRGVLKKIRPAGFWNLSWLGDKSAYVAEKWSGGDTDPGGDRARLQEFYLDHGYVTARIGEPQLTSLEADTPPRGKPERWVRLVIPVLEGERYQVGRVEFQGLTVFKEEEVRPLFGLAHGDAYDESRLRRGQEKLRDLYGRRGYFQATLTTRRDPDPETRRVNLVLAVEEDRQYSVGRIRFAGNHITRDKVLRREVVLDEGGVLDTEALRLSVRRINQLGYFKPIERAPELVPSEKAGDTFDVTFRVEEQNASRFSFGGGASGAEGTFLNAGFSTTNFLGLGETLELSAQSGTLTRNYQLAFTKPYVFDRPWSAGFDAYSRRQSYRSETAQGLQGYVDERTGASLLGAVRFGKWSRFSLGYAYEAVDISLRDASALDSAGVVDAIFLEDVGRRYESTLHPSLVRNTIDHPFTPRRGTRTSASFPVTGGPLGGTLDFVKPRLEAVAYLPHGSRTTLGLRAEAGWVLPFGQTARVDQATGRNRLPFYERFFLGGETQIRGYDYRSVGPRDASDRAIGGNKYLLFNAEYSVEVLGPLRLALFFDAGQAFADGDPFDLRRLRTSTGVELRVVLPMLNVPLRLIYAFNPNRDPFQPPRAFKFAIGTTF